MTKQGLDPDVWSAAYERGRRLTLDEAVALVVAVGDAAGVLDGPLRTPDAGRLARDLRAASTAAPQLGATVIVDTGRRPADRPPIGRWRTDMNENRASRGPNWGLLLLIPAAVIVAKGRDASPGDVGRRVGDRAGTPPATYGHGHHGRFASRTRAGGQPAAFRLPPKIEWMLDTWHTRAHESAATAERRPDGRWTEATDPKDTGKPTTA